MTNAGQASGTAKGVGVADGTASPHSSGYQLLQEADPVLNGGRLEVAFIDSSLPDFETLVEGVKPGVAVVLIDGTQDGLSQMAAWAEAHAGFDAIHVLGHGAEGTLQLGSLTLDSAMAEARAEDLATLGRSLSDDGDLLIYGCDVAGGDGEAFVAQLAAATGADVAASDDDTGAWAAGADWDLEVTSGQVTSQSVSVLGYQFTLNIVGSTVTDNYASSGTVGDGIEIDYGSFKVNISSTSISIEGIGNSVDAYSLVFSGGSLASIDSITFDSTNSTLGPSDYSGFVPTISQDGLTISWTALTGNNSGNNKIVYTIGTTATNAADTTAPTVASIARQTPSTETTNADTLTFQITFSENIGNIDAADFSVSGTTAAVTSVSGNGTTFEVTVAGGDLASANGTVALGFAGGQDIVDGAGNTLTNTTPTGANETYTLDNSGPTVASIARQTPSGATTNADSLTYRVTFSESVTNIGAADFSVTGTTGTVTGVSGSGTGYDVTVSGGDLASANGTVPLGFAGGQDISDGAGNALTNTTPTGANESYTLDNSGPTVASIARQTPSTETTGADSLVFRVTFSESVAGLDADDFTVTGTTGTVTGLSGSGTTYDITVSGGDLASLNGPVSLGFASGQNITDSAGNALTNTTPTGTNESYTVDNPPVTVSLSASGSPLAENGGVATVTATLSAASSADTLVTLSPSGTATGNGTDYTLSATTLTITAGQTTATATVTGVNDSFNDDDETIILDIDAVSSTQNATENGTQTATLTITDDDPAPTVSLSASGSPFDENGGVATLTATLSAAASTDTTVNLAFGGTATSGIDYTAGFSAITIAAGQTSATRTLTGTNDATNEGDETVIVDITTVNGGDGATEDGTQQATLTVTDDDVPPTVSLSSSGSPLAENGGVATVTATLSATAASDTTVTLTTTGTATGNGTDYTLSATTLTITAGQTTATATVTGVNDSFNDDDETVILDISAVSGGGGVTENGTQSTTLTITDDDAAPTVTLSASGSPLSEDAGVATVTATLSAAASTATTVTLAASGTATGSGTDYTLSATTLTIAAGQTTATATVTGVNDSFNDDDETVLLDITGVSGGDGAIEGGNQTTTLTITDDDPAPTVTLASSGSPLAENGGVATVTATLSAAASTATTVTLEPSGTATSGTDYTLSSTAITIAAGQTSATATVTGVNDATNEGDEKITLDIISVSGGDGATESGSQTTTLTITDDDTPSDSGGSSTPTIVVTPSTPTTPSTGGAVTTTAQTITNNGTTSGSAAIVQNTNNNGNLVTATLPPATTISSEGPTTAQSPTNALTTLVTSIQARGSSAEAPLVSGAQTFLTNLAASSTLDVRTIIPTTTSASLSSPIVITGTSGGSQSEAFVIDLRSLPSGSNLQLDNIEFASIMGSSTIVGGSGDNYVTADDSSQFISLGVGNDTLFGGAGADTIGSGSGRDFLYGEDDDDVVFGGTEDDAVHGGRNRDVVYGNQQNDVVYGNQDADTLYGGQNDDTLYGGQQEDLVHGNLGEDVLYGNRGADTLLGDAGADLLYGNQGADLLSGGAGNDTLYGGLSSDNGDVGTSFDVMYGGSGDDLFYGGEGVDWIYTGEGADRIYIETGNGFDVIADFDVAAGDRLLIATNVNGLTLTGPADIIALASDNPDGDVELNLGSHYVRLIGIRASDLTSDYFELF